MALTHYDQFSALPEDVQKQIKDLIEPVDPEAWVHQTIPDLGDRSFLDVINEPGGEVEATAYFNRMRSFEGQLTGFSGMVGLDEAMHFDESDLEANRAGVLSPNQRQHLWRGEWLRLAGSIACLVSGIAFAIAFASGAFGHSYLRFGGTGLGLVLLGAAFAYGSAQLWLDLASGQVARTQGWLRINENPTRTGVQYYALINGISFSISHRVRNLMVEGTATVYYLPRSRSLLSIESVPQAQG